MDATPLNLVRPEVPVELAALVAKMMAKEPERRFQTPGEVAKALTPFFKHGHEPGVQTEPRDLQRRAGSLVSQPVGGGSAPAPPVGTLQSPRRGLRRSRTRRGWRGKA